MSVVQRITGFLGNHLWIDGRMGRGRFFLFSFLLPWCILICLIVILPVFGDTIESAGLWIGVLLMIWTGWTSAVRRVHDFDESGKHALLYMIPMIGWFLSIELFFRRGTDGVNRYGAPANSCEGLNWKQEVER